MNERKIYLRRFLLALVSLGLFITICVFNEPATQTHIAQTSATHPHTKA